MTPQELKQLSGIPDDYDPSAPVAAPVTAPATVQPDPNDPRPALKTASGIPPNWTPTEVKSATTPISSEIMPTLAGFGSGFKTTIDYPAEKLAWFVGQGENLHAADQKARQQFLDQYGNDPYATAGDFAGKMAGAYTVARATRFLTAPAEAYALANPLIQRIPQAIPYVAKGENIASNALEGAVGSVVTGGNAALGAIGGAAAPYLQYATKAIPPIAGTLAGLAGWTHGLSAPEYFMSGGGAGMLSHYVSPGITWLAQQAGKVPSVTGALAGAVPNLLTSDPTATQAQAAATP